MGLHSAVAVERCANVRLAGSPPAAATGGSKVLLELEAKAHVEESGTAAIRAEAAVLRCDHSHLPGYGDVGVVRRGAQKVGVVQNV